MNNEHRWGETGQSDAIAIEKEFEQKPGPIAAQHFLDDYYRATSGPKPNVERFENEWRQLLHDNSKNHVADQMALEIESKFGTVYITRDSAKVDATRADANPDARLMRDLGTHVAANFNKVARTGKTWTPHSPIVDKAKHT